MNTTIQSTHDLKLKHRNKVHMNTTIQTVKTIRIHLLLLHRDNTVVGSRRHIMIVSDGHYF